MHVMRRVLTSLHSEKIMSSRNAVQCTVVQKAGVLNANLRIRHEIHSISNGSRFASDYATRISSSIRTVKSDSWKPKSRPEPKSAESDPKSGESDSTAESDYWP